MSDEKLLSVSDALVELGIGINAFDSLVKSGKVKVARYGDRGRRRVPASEIARLKTARVAGTSEETKIAGLVKKNIRSIESGLFVLSIHPDRDQWTGMDSAGLTRLASELRAAIGDGGQ